MSMCPECGKTSPPDRETGYDGQDFCSDVCEERYLETRIKIGEQAKQALEAMKRKTPKVSETFTATILESKNDSCWMKVDDYGVIHFPRVKGADKTGNHVRITVERPTKRERGKP